MFERYTEKARRLIFFARYEASQFGSPYIETEHMLLGLLREDKALTHRFLRSQEHVESIRKQIEDATGVREKISTSVDLPLSNESKRVLEYAMEEADRLSHKHIGCEHLLLGLLRVEGSFAAQLLNERGIRPSAVREQLARGAEAAIEALAGESSFLSDFSMPLTRMAQEERLLPLIGREKELEQIIHILGRSGKNNPVLVGEPGVGKRTIVEGLARRVVDGTAPSFFGAKLFVALDFSLIMAAAHHSERPREFLKTLAKELIAEGADTIYYFDELHTVLEPGSAGAHALGIALKPALLSGQVRCIAAATAEQFHATVKSAHWLERCFRAVEVQPATEDDTLNILQSIKNRFEKFHSVQYTAEALQAAVVYSNRHVKDRNLPDKAIDLIDDAGAYVRLQLESHPLAEEIRESRKRIKFIKGRMEDALVNRESEKARFYADEEHKERERLRQLQEKYKIAAPAVSAVTAEHIEEVLARWTGMPVAAIRAAGGAEAGAREKRVAAGKPPAAKNKPTAAKKKPSKRKKSK